MKSLKCAVVAFGTDVTDFFIEADENVKKAIKGIYIGYGVERREKVLHRLHL